MRRSVAYTCPIIETREGRLLAKSSWYAFVTCLGLYCCEVTVDPKRALVTVSRRIGWFFKTRRAIPFRQIDYVTYRYHGPSSSAFVRWMSEYDEEWYSVGLKLNDLSHVHLFRFQQSGRAPFDEESKSFAERLHKLIGVPLTQ
jgi:hypothetical protein